MIDLIPWNQKFVEIINNVCWKLHWSDTKKNMKKVSFRIVNRFNKNFSQNTVILSTETHKISKKEFWLFRDIM